MGLKQALLTSEEIKSLSPVNIFSSTSPRAKETARIIGEQLKLKPVAKKIFLEGFLPGQSQYEKTQKTLLLSSEKIIRQNKIKAAKKALDNARKFIFQTQNEERSCDVFVIHGNIIRHQVCKALRINGSKHWKFMDVGHTTLTVLKIKPDGKIVLLRFSDCGHLPHRMRTYT